MDLNVATWPSWNSWADCKMGGNAMPEVPKKGDIEMQRCCCYFEI